MSNVTKKTLLVKYLKAVIAESASKLEISRLAQQLGGKTKRGVADSWYFGSDAEASSKRLVKAITSMGLKAYTIYTGPYFVVKLSLAEAHLARVPNQLIEPDQNAEDGNEDEVEEVNEFCGMAGGGVMGYTGPLGGKTKKKTRK